MIDFERLRQLGDPWWISRPLTADIALVIPRDAVRLPGHAGGGQKRLSSERVVILGFAYNFVAANGNGFDLVQRDYTVSPGGGTTRVIFGDRATTAITRVHQSVTECYVPLAGGSTSPSLTNGADLEIDVTATGPTSGHILLWGVIAPESEALAHNYTGSPFDAGA